jgi:alanine racemase
VSTFCWCEINLSNLAHNLREIRSLLPKGVEIMGVVKADAYGHGSIRVSETLVKEGVERLGVFSFEEGLILREGGIRKPIFILGPILPDEADGVIEYNLTPSIFTMDVARALSKAAIHRGKTIKAHIKINTGMWRLGVNPDEAPRFIKGVLSLKGMEVEGIYSHLATAYCEDKTYAYEQFGIFKRLIERLESQKISIPCKHIASSAAILDLPEMNLDMVRPGIALYGLYPSKEVSRPLNLKPVMEFKTRIIYLEEVPKGSGLSYGRTYVAPKDIVVGVLPVGYRDGYPRLLSNRAEVLIRGKRARIVGVVCMDYSLVDVSHIKDIELNDEVVLFGTQGREEIEVDEIAEICGTINYEIVCGVGSRTKRVYVE